MKDVLYIQQEVLYMNKLSMWAWQLTATGEQEIVTNFKYFLGAVLQQLSNAINTVKLPIFFVVIAIAAFNIFSRGLTADDPGEWTRQIRGPLVWVGVSAAILFATPPLLDAIVKFAGLAAP